MSADNSTFAQILNDVFNNDVMNEIENMFNGILFQPQKRQKVQTDKKKDGSYIIHIKNEDSFMRIENPRIKMTTTTQNPIPEKKVLEEPIKLTPPKAYLVHRIGFKMDGKEYVLKLKHERFIVRP